MKDFVKEHPEWLNGHETQGLSSVFRWTAAALYPWWKS